MKSPVGSFIGTGIFGVLTVMFLFLARSVFSDYNAVKSWPKVNGTMVSGRVEERVSKTRRKGVTRTSTTYVPVVSYEYEVNGVRYSGSTWKLPKSSGSSSRSGAEEFLARHPVGRATPVHVNPGNPSESFLELGSGGAGWILVVLAALCGLGAAFMGMEGWRRISVAAASGGYVR